MGGNPQDRLSGRLPIPPPRPLPPTPIPVRTPTPATPPCFPPSPTYFTAAAVLYRSPSPSSIPSRESPSPAPLRGSMRRSLPTPMTQPTSFYTPDIESTAGGPPTTFTALASSLPQPQPPATHKRRWGIRLPRLPQLTPQDYILLPLLLTAFAVTLTTLTLAATSLARYPAPYPSEISLTSISTLITTSGVLCLLSLLWGALFFKHSGGRWGVVGAVVGVGVAVVGVGYGREKWDERDWWTGEETGKGGTGLREWACRRWNWGVGWEREKRVCGDLTTAGRLGVGVLVVQVLILVVVVWMVTWGYWQTWRRRREEMKEKLPK